MTWTTPVDVYCERLGPGFWAEPLNAVSNLSFIIAALLCWRMAARHGRFDPLTRALILNLFVIGVGSFLWHSFAQAWAGAADTLPIMVFILTYIWAATRHYVGTPAITAWLAVAGSIAFAAGFLSAWSRFLPGVEASQGYLPVLVILIFYAALLIRRRHPAATGLLAGAAIFSVSLTFRSVDMPLCEAAPMGTHFMWHLLNGVLLGVVTATFIRHADARLEPKPAEG